MIKAVIFDFNGVFLQGERFSVRMSRQYGMDIDEFVAVLSELMDRTRLPDSPPAYSLWKPYLDKWGINLTENEFFDYWVADDHLATEFIPYLKQLRAGGLKLFILTKNFRERARLYRRMFGDFFQLFDGVYFSFETGYVKPDPMAYRHLLKVNGLQPQECIYFDDSGKNVETALSLGIHAQKYVDLPHTRSFIESLT